MYLIGFVICEREVGRQRAEGGGVKVISELCELLLCYWAKKKKRQLKVTLKYAKVFALGRKRYDHLRTFV